MTMPVDTPRREFVEDGVTTVHPIGFKFIDAADITVTRFVDDGEGGFDEVLLVQPTHYSVTGGNYDTGQVTKVNGGTVGATLRIDRNTPISQPLDYLQGDDFSAESHEHGLDRLTMIAQELKRDMLTVDDVHDIIAAMLKAGDGIALEVNGDGDELTIINTYDAEFIFNTIRDALLEGSNIEITPNNETNTITIASTAGGGVGSLADFLMLSGDQQGGGETGTGDGTFAEQVRAIMFATLVGVGITITEDVEANTITLTNTIDAEFIRDTIGDALVEGLGIEITEDDGGNTITISAPNAGVSLEEVRDMLAAALSPGTLISIVPDDGGDVIVISTTALDPTYKGLVPSAIAADRDFADADNGRALNVTGDTITVTIEPQATTALSAGWACVIRNNHATGTLTIARGAGVELYKNGGTVDADAAIAPGGYATIQRWAADEFTISGPGVS